MLTKQYIDKIYNLQKEYLINKESINILNPFVSVHVITYQHAKYIAKCLDGILMQKTDFPFEIVIGEDESTDGTREICINYAKKYRDKIRLFLRDRKQSVITSSTGNKIYLNGILTLRSCNGKYIALCEGDDYWTDPLKLQKQMDFLNINSNIFYSNE